LLHAKEMTEIAQPLSMATQTATLAALMDRNLRRAIRLLSLLAVMAVFAFCFFASSICIAIVLASFLVILADPAVQFLERLRFARYVAAGALVLAGAAVLGALIYGSYTGCREALLMFGERT